MKMPTSKERKDRFKELLNDKGNDVKKDLQTVRDQLVEYQIGSAKEREQYKNFDVNNIKTKEDLDVAYSIFNHAMEASYYYKSTREYMDIMQKNYDVMVDDNNQGDYNDARDPIIVFNGRKFLKDVSDQKAPKYLTWNEILNNSDEVQDVLEREGKRLKL